jgi:hypothetical protein
MLTTLSRRMSEPSVTAIGLVRLAHTVGVVILKDLQMTMTTTVVPHEVTGVRDVMIIGDAVPLVSTTLTRVMIAPRLVEDLAVRLRTMALQPALDTPKKGMMPEDRGPPEEPGAMKSLI